jgi:hypothetical protein
VSQTGSHRQLATTPAPAAYSRTWVHCAYLRQSAVTWTLLGSHRRRGEPRTGPKTTDGASGSGYADIKQVGSGRVTDDQDVDVAWRRAGLS